MLRSVKGIGIGRSVKNKPGREYGVYICPLTTRQEKLDTSMVSYVMVPTTLQLRDQPKTIHGQEHGVGVRARSLVHTRTHSAQEICNDIP